MPLMVCQVFVVALDPAIGRRVLDVARALGRLHRALIRAWVAGEHAVIQPRLAAFGRRALPLEFLAGLEHLEHVADVTPGCSPP